MASRYTNATLNNGLNGTRRNPVREALSPTEMLRDGTLGGVFGGLSYTGSVQYPFGKPPQTRGEYNTQKAWIEKAKKFCDEDTIGKVDKQKVSNPVDLPEDQLIQQAKEITYSPVTQGPLKESVANTFNGGTYTERVLLDDTVMYRVSGGQAGKVGSYLSRTPQGGGLQSQLDLGLNPNWGNTAENISKVVVPKGITIYEAIAAPQDIMDSMGNTIGTLPGGGNQVYIPKVNEGWFQ